MKYYKQNLYLSGLFLLTLILFSSCGPVSVSSRYEKGKNYHTYHTYSFYKKGIDALNLSNSDKLVITGAAEQSLNNKGMSKDDTQPDLIVNIRAYSKTVVYNDYYGLYGPYVYGGWEDSGANPEGELEFDLVDAKTNVLVWSGKGKGLDIKAHNNRNKRFAKAVHNILSFYPPKTEKSGGIY